MTANISIVRLLTLSITLSSAMAIAESIPNLEISSSHGNIDVGIACKRDFTTKKMTAEVDSMSFNTPENVDMPSDQISFYSGKLGVDNDPSQSTQGLHYSIDGHTLKVATADNSNGVRIGSLNSKVSHHESTAIVACQEEIEGLVSFVQQELSQPNLSPTQIRDFQDELEFYKSGKVNFSTAMYISQDSDSHVSIARKMGENMTREDMLGYQCQRHFERDYAVDAGADSIRFKIVGYTIWNCE